MLFGHPMYASTFRMHYANNRPPKQIINSIPFFIHWRIFMVSQKLFKGIVTVTNKTFRTRRHCAVPFAGRTRRTCRIFTSCRIITRHLAFRLFEILGAFELRRCFCDVNFEQGHCVIDFQ